MLFLYGRIERRMKMEIKHSCWNCLLLNMDKVESKSCIKGHKLKFIFNVNECSDWNG